MIVKYLLLGGFFGRRLEAAGFSSFVIFRCTYQPMVLLGSHVALSHQ